MTSVYEMTDEQILEAILDFPRVETLKDARHFIELVQERTRREHERKQM